jgi:hypothetical protein
MATHPVLFAFVIPNPAAENHERWFHEHNIPSRLIGPLHVQTTPGHRAQLIPEISRILASHQSEVNNKLLGTTCLACGAQATFAFMRPMAYLHDASTALELEDDSRRVDVYVYPICKKESCREHATATEEEKWDQVIGEEKARLAKGKVCPCGKSEGTQRCATCKVSSYCCKEHQKEHWKEHKKACKALLAAREFSEGQRMWFSRAEEASNATPSGISGTPTQ